MDHTIQNRIFPRIGWTQSVLSADYKLHHASGVARIVECPEKQLAVPNPNASASDRHARLFCRDGCSVVLCIF